MQLFSRLGSKQSLEGLDNALFSDIPQGVKPGDVIEFHGAEGCGKTEMLLHLIANCILPKSWKDLHLGGRGVGIIFVDTDFHFQLLRLVTIMEYRIHRAMRKIHEKTGIPNFEEKFVLNHASASSSGNSSKDIEDFIRVCLARLFILRCNSSLELLASMLSLEQMLIAKPEVCVVMIDSLSAFYWIDRSTGGESTTDQEQNMRKIIEVIQKYSKEHHLVFIATTHAIFSASKRTQDGVENYLCKTWLNVVRYRYLLRSHTEYDTSSGSQAVYSAQRTSPKSNVVKKFHIYEKGIEFIR